MKYVVTTFYKFLPVSKQALVRVKAQLEAAAQERSVFGLLLLAEEGVNATLAGNAEQVQNYKQVIEELFGDVQFKDSLAPKMPFKRFKVKIKPEIVQLKRADIQPTGNEPHMSPEEWDKMVESGEAVLIDVRNWYETKVGAFKNAIDPKTWSFSQFPDWVKGSNIPKDQKIGIYCTGGIRCEKAAVAMKELGYENVHQLDGGILNYIEERPGKNFEGDCFVFDHRVAVGQDLAPSQTYGRCWMCGNAGSIVAACDECSTRHQICEDCVASERAAFCSKNCHYRNSSRVRYT